MLIVSLQTGDLVAQTSIKNRIKDGHGMLGNSRGDMDQYSGKTIDLWLESRQHTHTEAHHVAATVHNHKHTHPQPPSIMN